MNIISPVHIPILNPNLSEDFSPPVISFSRRSMSSSNQFRVDECPCPSQKRSSEGSLTAVNFSKKTESLLIQAGTQIILGFCFLRHQILEKRMKG